MYRHRWDMCLLYKTIKTRSNNALLCKSLQTPLHPVVSLTTCQTYIKQKYGPLSLYNIFCSCIIDTRDIYMEKVNKCSLKIIDTGSQEIRVFCWWILFRYYMKRLSKIYYRYSLNWKLLEVSRTFLEKIINVDIKFYRRLGLLFIWNNYY